MTKVGCISLGCPKNRLDSEVMLGLLQAAGYEIVPEAAAEILIVNTCGFIQAAKEEAIQTTLEAAQYKTQGACRALIMAGCFAQRYVTDLIQEMPEVDFFMGVDDVPEIAAICQELERHLEREKPTPASPNRGIPTPTPPRRGIHPPLNEVGRYSPAGRGEGWVSRVSSTLAQKNPSTYIYDHASPRLPLGAKHTAYVKIAEGCRYQCAFCAIPLIRGKLRSRPLPSIVQEVTALAAQGVQEVILIAQDTTSYGVDLTGKSQIVPLLEQLAATPVSWIRLMYAYPTSLDLPLMQLIAREAKICTYLDLPLQHIDNAILKKMRRAITEAQTRTLLDQLRAAIPGLTLRTSLIVGFPGETERAFQKLVDFVRDAQFERLGVFAYSPEEGTPAYDLPNQVPAEIAAARYQQVMEIQAAIALQKNQALVGTVQTVLVDGVSAETELLLEARTAGQAPDIDGVVYINEGQTAPGAFEKVLITEAFPYDLVGQIVAI